jgi:hypothetical protein
MNAQAEGCAKKVSDVQESMAALTSRITALEEGLLEFCNRLEMITREVEPSSAKLEKVPPPVSRCTLSSDIRDITIRVDACIDKINGRMNRLEI